MPWLETTGRMMEEDGESGWEEWLIAFKDATMPFEWAINEQRSLYRLPFTQVCDWSTFDHQAILHRRLLMGTNLYPSDKQMAVLYRAACPEILFTNLMTRPDFKSGTWSEVRTLLQTEVGMYMEGQKYTFAPIHAKVQKSTQPTTPSSPHQPLLWSSPFVTSLSLSGWLTHSRRLLQGEPLQWLPTSWPQLQNLPQPSSLYALLSSPGRQSQSHGIRTYRSARRQPLLWDPNWQRRWPVRSFLFSLSFKFLPPLMDVPLLLPLPHSSTLDMGAGTSFFRSVSGCRVRLKGSNECGGASCEIGWW